MLCSFGEIGATDQQLRLSLFIIILEPRDVETLRTGGNMIHVNGAQLERSLRSAYISYSHDAGRKDLKVRPNGDLLIETTETLFDVILSNNMIMVDTNVGVVRLLYAEDSMTAEHKLKIVLESIRQQYGTRRGVFHNHRAPSDRPGSLN